MLPLAWSIMWDLYKTDSMGIWDAWKVIYASAHTAAQRTPGTKHLFAWFSLTHSFSLNGGKGAETLRVGSSWAKTILRAHGIVTGEWKACTLSGTIVREMRDNSRGKKRKTWTQFVKDLKCEFEKSWDENLFKTINISDFLHTDVILQCIWLGLTWERQCN